MNTSQPINEMEIEDWKHLDKINTSSQIDTSKKYKAGKREHGGNLQNKGLDFFAKEMRAEAVDQMVYTHCALEGLERIKKICEECSESHIGFSDILLIINGTDKDLK